MPSIHDWSLVAANNANADSDINWAEGQPPASVNNSARVMMQRVKQLLNDLGGVPVAGGTENTVTVAAASPFTAYADGIRVSFRASATSTGPVNLNVNSIASRSIRAFTSTGERALVAGEIQANCIYEVVWSTVVNGGSGGWILLNPTTQSIPSGMISMHGANTAPTGWLECTGAAVSRSTYSALFSVVGTTWGNGNGSTTFNLPDLRGQFVRGWDHGRGVDSGRSFASVQGESLNSHTHTGTTNAAGSHSHDIDTDDDVGGGTDRVGRVNAEGSTTLMSTRAGGNHTHSFTTDSTGGSETRPRNTAVMFVIKT